MKPLIIIAIAFVLLIPTSSFAYAQSSLNCPDGTYYGKDNQGNDACRDIKTNQIIESTTNTQIFQDLSSDNSIFYLLIIGVLVIVIIVILVKRPKSRSDRVSRKPPKYKKNVKYSQSRMKISKKTIIRIIGVIFVMSGFFFGTKIEQGSPNFQENFLIFVALVIIGIVMIVQLKGLKNLATPNCQCCDCQNCNRNHNHWTHREDDDRHHRGW